MTETSETIAERLQHDAADLAQFDNRVSGVVSSLLFNGAASRILVRDEVGEEIEVTLPQSGEFANLTKGAPVHIGWAGDQTTCFADRG